MGESGETSIVAVNEDNIKATVGITGAATGFLLGGPTTAVLLAAAANYVANKESDASQIINSAGQALLQTYNLLLKANDEFSVTDKLGDKVSELKEKAKDGQKGDAVQKIDDAWMSISSKTSELNEEYGLTGAAVDLLGKAGDLSIELIDSGLKFADENDVFTKAKDLISDAATKVKDRAGRE